METVVLAGKDNRMQRICLSPMGFSSSSVTNAVMIAMATTFTSLLMRKNLIFALAIVACGCQHAGYESCCYAFHEDEMEQCSCESNDDLAYKYDEMEALDDSYGTHYPPKEVSETLDTDDRDRLHRFYPITLDKIEKNRSLAIQDIKNLTRAGVSDEVIIYEIAATKSTFYLTLSDKTELEQAGAPKKVIQHMLMTSDAH